MSEEESSQHPLVTIGCGCLALGALGTAFAFLFGMFPFLYRFFGLG